jgi:hypothetical protein
MANFCCTRDNTKDFQAPRNEFGVKPCEVKPPSIQTVCPVVNEEVGMHRNAIRLCNLMSFSHTLEWYTALEVSYKILGLNICHNKFTDSTKNTWGLLENSNTS